MENSFNETLVGKDSYQIDTVYSENESKIYSNIHKVGSDEKSGYAITAINGKNAIIEDLYLTANIRRSGVGSSVLSGIMEIASKVIGKGVNICGELTGIDNPYIDAKFFAKNGFNIIVESIDNSPIGFDKSLI